MLKKIINKFPTLPPRAGGVSEIGKIPYFYFFLFLNPSLINKKAILRVTESIAVSTEPKWILRHNIPDNIKLSSNIRTFYSFDRSSKSISVSLFGTNLPKSLSLTVTHLHDPGCDGANLVQKAAARLSPSGDFGIKANLFLIFRRATLKGFNFIAKSVI